VEAKRQQEIELQKKREQIKQEVKEKIKHDQ